MSETLETNTLQGSIEISHHMDSYDLQNESSEKTITSPSQNFDARNDERETFDVDAEIEKLSQEMNSMQGTDYEDSRLFDESNTSSLVEGEMEPLFDFRDWH